MIKKILYATDMSENARYAFSYAASLADKYDAKITLLHILEIIPESVDVQVRDLVGAEKWKKLQEEKQEVIIERLKSRLSDFCDEMGTELKECKFLVEDIIVAKGIPVDEILKKAELIGADMIIMGTHGYGLVLGALIGSTARRVVRRSKIPVLVVRQPEK